MVNNNYYYTKQKHFLLLRIARCTVTLNMDGSVWISLSEPVRALTPGQVNYNTHALQVVLKAVIVTIIYSCTHSRKALKI